MKVNVQFLLKLVYELLIRSGIAYLEFNAIVTLKVSKTLTETQADKDWTNILYKIYARNCNPIVTDAQIKRYLTLLSVNIVIC